MTEEVAGAYLKPGTLVRPGPRGRALRLLIGGPQLTATILALVYASVFLRPETLDLDNALQVFVLIYLGFTLVLALPWLDYLVNKSFGVIWGNRLYWVLLGLAAITLPLSLAFSGAIWALPFSLLVFLVILYTTGQIGIPHVLAAILATPGCEARSIPHLIAILKRRDFEGRRCPGMWDGIDAREAARRSA